MNYLVAFILLVFSGVTILCGAEELTREQRSELQSFMIGNRTEVPDHMLEQFNDVKKFSAVENTTSPDIPRICVRHTYNLPGDPVALYEDRVFCEGSDSNLEKWVFGNAFRMNSCIRTLKKMKSDPAILDKFTPVKDLFLKLQEVSRGAGGDATPITADSFEMDIIVNISDGSVDGRRLILDVRSQSLEGNRLADLVLSKHTPKKLGKPRSPEANLSRLMVQSGACDYTQLLNSAESVILADMEKQIHLRSQATGRASPVSRRTVEDRRP